MSIINKKISIDTKGAGDLVDITAQVKRIVSGTSCKTGTVVIFVIGSTAAVTTFEFEPGMIKDMRELCERLIPSDKHYNHDETWGDANGFSHLRAALFGPSLAVPFDNSELVLGTWQQIVLAEFDSRPRTRQVVVQVNGE